MITQERVKELVSYDPDTGHFTNLASSVYSRQPFGARVGTKHKTKGYRYITLDKKTYREHRVAFLYMTGKWPADQVDHINQVKDDNRWENLREATPLTNCWNRPVYKTNKSGYTGVVWNKSVNKWQVLVRSGSVQKYLGVFDDVDEAGRVAFDWYMEVR